MWTVEQVSLVSSLAALLPGQPVAIPPSPLAILSDALLVREMALAVPAKISG